jgi:hypothetical protein
MLLFRPCQLAMGAKHSANLSEHKELSTYLTLRVFYFIENGELGFEGLISCRKNMLSNRFL